MLRSPGLTASPGCGTAPSRRHPDTGGASRCALRLPRLPPASPKCQRQRRAHGTPRPPLRGSRRAPGPVEGTGGDGAPVLPAPQPPFAVGSRRLAPRSAPLPRRQQEAAAHARRRPSGPPQGPAPSGPLRSPQGPPQRPAAPLSAPLPPPPQRPLRSPQGPAAPLAAPLRAQPPPAAPLGARSGRRGCRGPCRDSPVAHHHTLDGLHRGCAAAAGPCCRAGRGGRRSGQRVAAASALRLAAGTRQRPPPEAGSGAERSAEEGCGGRAAGEQEAAAPLTSARAALGTPPSRPAASAPPLRRHSGISGGARVSAGALRVFPAAPRGLRARSAALGPARLGEGAAAMAALPARAADPASGVPSAVPRRLALHSAGASPKGVVPPWPGGSSPVGRLCRGPAGLPSGQEPGCGGGARGAGCGHHFVSPSGPSATGGVRTPLCEPVPRS